MARAFIFPGQGAQSVGMGKELAEAFPAAREVFEEVNDALFEDLTKIMWEGPEEDLTLTQNTQPALMAVSLAAVRVLESEGGFTLAEKGDFVAGHSLGEYSALASVSTFSLADTARLLRLRGQAMQEATPLGTGAMAAILGLDLPDVAAIAAEAAQGDAGKEVCAAANDNSPGQVVISGHKTAVERAADLAKERGAKRAVLLNVSAPFHCALMQPAADKMQEALGETPMHAPSLPLIANVTAAPTSDPEEIKTLLVEQVTGTVRWRESMAGAAEMGVTELVELGNGKVLSGLARRVSRDLKAGNAGTPQEIENLLKEL